MTWQGASPPEPVAHARLGDEVARAGRFLLEFLAQLHQVHPEEAAAGANASSRYLGKQLRLRYEHAGPDERLVHLPLGRSKVNLHVGPATTFRTKSTVRARRN